MTSNPPTTSTVLSHPTDLTVLSQRPSVSKVPSNLVKPSWAPNVLLQLTWSEHLSGKPIQSSRPMMLAWSIVSAHPTFLLGPSGALTVLFHPTTLMMPSNNPTLSFDSSLSIVLSSGPSLWYLPLASIVLLSMPTRSFVPTKSIIPSRAPMNTPCLQIIPVSLQICGSRASLLGVLSNKPSLLLPLSGKPALSFQPSIVPSVSSQLSMSGAPLATSSISLTIHIQHITTQSCNTMIQLVTRCATISCSGMPPDNYTPQHKIEKKTEFPL